MRPETLHKFILVGIVAGIGLSVWAALETVLPGLQSSCSVNPFWSCSAVDQSGNNHFGPIPDWVVGLGGFVAMLLVDIPLYRTWKRSYLVVLLVLSSAGVAFSLYFLWVELAVIHAVCPVCLSTYLANGLVFVSAAALWLKGRAVPGAERASAERSAKTPDPAQPSTE